MNKGKTYQIVIARGIWLMGWLLTASIPIIAQAQDDESRLRTALSREAFDLEGYYEFRGGMWTDTGCSRELLFESDGSFYLVQYCFGDTSLTKGEYTIKDQQLELKMSGNWSHVRHFPTKDPGYREFSDDFIKSEYIYLKIEQTEKGMVLVDEETGYKANRAGSLSQNLIDKLRTQKLVSILDWSIEREMAYSYDSYSYAKKDEEKIQYAYSIYIGLEPDGIGEYDHRTGQFEYPSSSGWGPDGILYPKDSAFKLFRFYGGPYGFSVSIMYAIGLIQLPSGKIIEIPASPDRLFQTGKGVYAVLGEYQEGGISGGNSYTFYQFKIVNEELVEVPLFDEHHFPEFADQIGMTGRCQFSVSFPSAVEQYDQEYIQYDESSGVLSFGIVKDGLIGWCEDLSGFVPKDEAYLEDNEIIIFNGSFTIKEGKVVDHKEEWEKYEKDD